MKDEWQILYLYSCTHCPIYYINIEKNTFSNSQILKFFLSVYNNRHLHYFYTFSLKSTFIFNYQLLFDSYKNVKSRFHGTIITYRMQVIMQYKISNKVFPLDQKLDLASFSCITC